MRNRMYGGVRGRKTKVGEKLLRFPPTRLGLTPLSFSLPKEKFLLAYVEIMLWAGNNFWGRILNPYNNSGS